MAHRGEGAMRDLGLAERARYAFLLPRLLPGTLNGRATGWMTPTARKWRNWAVVATAIEVAACLASLPLGATRGGVARLSAGLNALLAVVAGLGLYGAVRCSYIIVGMHCALVMGVLFIFVAFFVLSTLLTRSEQEADETFVLLAVFIFFLADLVVACVTCRATAALRAYAKQCEAEDEAAGGAGRGVERRQAELARWVAGNRDRAPVQAGPAAGAGADGGGAEALRPRAEVLRLAEAAARPPPGATGERDGHKAGAGPEPARPAAAGSDGRDGGDDGEDDGAGLCPVCLEASKDAVFVDCGHAACMSCALAVERRYGHCFLCRKRIRSVLRVFV